LCNIEHHQMHQAFDVCARNVEISLRTDVPVENLTSGSSWWT